jgi:hypothetical protein
MSDARLDLAAQLLREFATRTGVDGAAKPRRYLWTDAFATCLALELGTRIDPAFMGAADRLVDQVHRVLGHHRGDDGREGWLSGLDEVEGKRHPTRGGLRIGKPRPERRADEPFDPEAEWDRDGQYFHYLTRWIHALDVYATRGDRPQAREWAVELADVAVRRFAVEPLGGPGRIAWKMSLDLSRPQVASMGHHDPLDGLVTLLSLRAHCTAEQGAPLEALLAQLATLASGRDFLTADPLGLGGLLADAWTLLQLPGATPGDPLPTELLALAAEGIDQWMAQSRMGEAADRRLAFRELGLAIGLQVVPRVRERVAATGAGPELSRVLARLERQCELGDRIEAFWSNPEHRQGRTWLAHEDINAIMLATRLAPGGYLDEPAR